MSANKKRKTAGATKRRRPFPFQLWFKRVMIGLAGSFVVMALIVVARLVGGLEWQPLPIQELALNSPLVYQPQSDLDEISQQYLGKSLLFVDLEKLRVELEALPWVQSVSVGKQWPDKIDVSLKEYEPVANWNGDSVLNAEGYPLAKPALDLKLADLKGPDNYSKLVMDHYLLFSKMFSVEGYAVKGVTMKPRGSWNIELENEIVIYIGEQEVLQRSQRVVDLLNYKKESIDAIEYIDARYQNGIAIKEKQNLSSEVQHDVAA